MIEIDGSHGEGGGAILRQTLGMAAYSGLTVRIFNIRAGRKQPGLQPQHLKSVEAAGAICGARVQGAGLGSREIIFAPGTIQGGHFQFDVGTAGSTALVLQTVLLPCLCQSGEFEFELIGGTHVPWSPPVEYLKNVTLPALQTFGSAEVIVERRGYHPKGGGQLRVRIRGGAGLAVPLELNHPAPAVGIRGVSHASRSLRERGVAERQADAASHMLGRLGHPVDISVDYSDTFGEGSGITLWTESAGGVALGGSALGERGASADEVGREAAASLLTEMESGAAVDRFLADQLISFLAVSGGSLLTSDVTSHTHTNIHVAERMIGTGFAIEGLKITAKI